MKNKILAVILAAAVAGCSTQKPVKTATAAPAKTKNVEVTIDGVAGFQDTPLQPDGLWHVHDPARPQPPMVTPGTFSENATPPSDAIVLFDGKDLSQWRDQKTGGAAPWQIEDGAMIAEKDYIVTTNQFADIQLHLEFREPTPPTGSGQARGNSGVFFMGQYEIQVLDCYGNKTYADGATAGIYGQHPALVNACRPPGEWQTYDIIFNVPSRFFITASWRRIIRPFAVRPTGKVPANTRRTARPVRWRCNITTTRLRSATSGCARCRWSMILEQLKMKNEK